MAATTLVGLYFVADIGGPASGVVDGTANHETLMVRILSEPGDPARWVPVAVAMGWTFYGSRADAEKAFGEYCKEAFCLKPPSRLKSAANASDCFS